MAMDLGLHHCLPYLTDRDTGIHKSHEELVQERHIVAGARIWLTVSLILVTLSGQWSLIFLIKLFKIDTEYDHHLSTMIELILDKECRLHTAALPSFVQKGPLPTLVDSSSILFQYLLT